MSYQEETKQVISGDNILNYRLKKNHCACVWILSDVDFTDEGGGGGAGGGGLYWLLPFFFFFLLNDVNKKVVLSQC